METDAESFLRLCVRAIEPDERVRRQGDERLTEAETAMVSIIR
ncbi:hypothetical protein [Allokutzneria oryzae]|uniref:Uncharacterized protein n=1 Tax=Allokutzneria oryzae TaxID=1378989 RepID=A0ABV5ZS10_9PSEU